jgi:hypothetical protein
MTFSFGCKPTPGLPRSGNRSVFSIFLDLSLSTEDGKRFDVCYLGSGLHVQRYAYYRSMGLHTYKYTVMEPGEHPTICRRFAIDSKYVTGAHAN